MVIVAARKTVRRQIMGERGTMLLLRYHVCQFIIVLSQPASQAGSPLRRLWLSICVPPRLYFVPRCERNAELEVEEEKLGGTWIMSRSVQ